jgi:hypothetical protein
MKQGGQSSKTVSKGKVVARSQVFLREVFVLGCLGDGRRVAAAIAGGRKVLLKVVEEGAEGRVTKGTKKLESDR